MMTNCDPNGWIIVKVYRYKCNSCKFDRQGLSLLRFSHQTMPQGYRPFSNTTAESFKANLSLSFSSLVFTCDEVSCSAELSVKKVYNLKAISNIIAGQTQTLLYDSSKLADI